MNIILIVVLMGLGLVTISAMIYSTFAPQPIFSQPTNGTNATAIRSSLSSHVGAKTCVNANIEYSPGVTIIMPALPGHTELKTCQSDGTWEFGDALKR